MVPLQGHLCTLQGISGYTLFLWCPGLFLGHHVHTMLCSVGYLLAPMTINHDALPISVRSASRRMAQAASARMLESPINSDMDFLPVFACTVHPTQHYWESFPKEGEGRTSCPLSSSACLLSVTLGKLPSLSGAPH